VIVDEVDSMMVEPYVGEVETILQASPLYSPATARRLMQHSVDPSMDGASSGPRSSLLSSHIPEEAAERELAVMKEDPMQRLLWLASATSHDPAVATFADRYTARSGKGWSEISVTDGAALPDTITHGLISIGRERAPEYLKRVLLAKPVVESALIFVNDPYKVEVVVKDLSRYGIIAAPLHGDTNKDDRKVSVLYYLIVCEKYQSHFCCICPYLHLLFSFSLHFRLCDCRRSWRASRTGACGTW